MVKLRVKFIKNFIIWIIEYKFKGMNLYEEINYWKINEICKNWYII